MEGTYTLRIIRSFLELSVEIAPYFLISILIQVGLIQYIKKREIPFRIEKKIPAILVGALLGMISPLPTYAAAPIGLSFIPLGIPLAGALAFIMASPLINPSIFFLTYTQLGAEIAVARVVASFILATGGAFILSLLAQTLESRIKTKKSLNNNRPFWLEFWRSLLFFGKYFALALLISAFVKALVSPQLVLEILGAHTHRGLIVAIALGVPFYSCGGAAIPFVEVLSEMGMSQGAVLAFFIAGPATKLETMYIFSSMLGSKIFIVYLVLMLVGAYISGVLIIGFSI